MPRPCHCNRVRTGEPYEPGQCNRCWLFAHNAAVRRAWGEPSPPAVVHTPRTHPAPLRVVRLDGSVLAGGASTSAADGHSNASVFRWRGRLLLAYRHRNAGADVWLTELDPDTYQPLSAGRRLNLDHPKARFGREDPRLFEHAGALHVSFTGVNGRQGPTSVLYARLGDDLAVERVYYPKYDGRQPWEKNWGFFSQDGHLLAVYSIAPHTVLLVDGDRATPAYETPTPFAWSGGVLRGGAAPVRVGDRWHCWFHGRVSWAGKPTYTAGVYVFDAKPPYRVLRMTPRPVLYGDTRTNDFDYYANVIFPCGAVLDGQTWVVSSGVHDRWIEVAEFDAGDVCRATAGPADPPAGPAKRSCCG